MAKMRKAKPRLRKVGKSEATFMRKAFSKVSGLKGRGATRKSAAGAATD